MCLSGLIALLSNVDGCIPVLLLSLAIVRRTATFVAVSELIVAESVVVIKKLLQTQQGSHGEIIGQMARLVTSITVPHARAAILWLVGEHCDKKGVSKIAPDVLRSMAKTFGNEVMTSLERTVCLKMISVSIALVYRKIW